MLSFFPHLFSPLDDYHGINGNVSLDRRSEIVQSPNRYELALGTADRSNNNSLSRETGSYDLSSAEARARNGHFGGSNGGALHTVDENVINNNYQNTQSLTTGNGSNGGRGDAATGTGPNNSGTLRSMDEELRKKKWPTDRAYFLAKELLMTERTYKKDLDVINTVRRTKHFIHRRVQTLFLTFFSFFLQWFREELTPEDLENLQPLFQYFESMLEHHSVFLRDLEHRILLWEGRGGHETHRIGDVMLKNMVVLPVGDSCLRFK